MSSEYQHSVALFFQHSVYCDGMVKKEPIREIFATALKRVLAQKGKTQTWLANLLGVTPQSISLYVASDREGDEATRRSIAQVLGYSYEEFLDIGRKIDTQGPEAREPQTPLVDQVTEKILLMLADLDEEKKREVLRYIEEKKLLTDLLKERKGGGEA